MRILFVGQHFPRPNNPIIGTWALSQLRALSALGHEIVVISPVARVPVTVQKILRRGSSANCPASHDWDGIQAHYPKWSVYPVGPLGKVVRYLPGLFVTAGWWQIRAQVRAVASEFQPEVIFAHHAAFGGFIASRLAAMSGVPWFVTDHDYDEISSCQTNRWRRGHYQRVLRSVSRWFAVSEKMHHLMTETFPSVPSSTLHNGADNIPAVFRERQRPDDYAGALLVLCAGFFYRRKNVPLTVRAFDLVAAKYPEAILLVAGSGETESQVLGEIDRAVHRERIRFLGRLEHSAVLQHMCWSDVFISVGEREPFATVFSESMMAGTPIIFAEDGGICDVARSGVHGIAVPPGDLEATTAALEGLLRDAERRRAMGIAAREMAEQRLTWKANAERLAGILIAEVSATARFRQ